MIGLDPSFSSFSFFMGKTRTEGRSVYRGPEESEERSIYKYKYFFFNDLPSQLSSEGR